MVTNKQVRRLRKLSNTEKNQEIAASKAGMDPKTARRYLGLERLPSELKKERPWRTREDPFGEVWDVVERQIQESPGLGARRRYDPSVSFFADVHSLGAGYWAFEGGSTVRERNGVGSGSAFKPSGGSIRSGRASADCAWRRSSAIPPALFPVLAAGISETRAPL